MEGGAGVIKVALCTDGVFPHALGGMQRHSRLLAEHLAGTAGIKLVALHPHEGRVFPPEVGIEEVPVAAIDSGRLYLRELWRYSGRVADALDRMQPDVVLSQGYSVWKGMRRFTPRLVVMPHGLEMFQGITPRDKAIGLPFRMAMRHVVQRAGHVVSLGGKLTPILTGLAEGSAARIVPIPNAVEIPGAAPAYPSEGDALKLLFVGRFAFNKGIDVLLQVARALHAEGKRVRFTLAGDGPERASMERDGLPANVVIAGRVADGELERLYTECHALVLPTRFEGMPTVVLEAMARARPVIVGDVGASAELVTAGNGFLIEPGSVPAFSAAIERLLAMDHAQRAAMGAAGYALAAQSFSWRAVATRFAQLIAQVAAGRATA